MHAVGDTRMAEGSEDAKRGNERFNNIVALTIAVLATFMAIGAIKSSNVAQGIQQAQVERNDNWAWYQAVRVREDMATYEMAHLQRLTRTNASPAEARRLADEIRAQDGEIAHVRERKSEVQALARAAEARTASLNVFDDQYDISSALISIAMSLLALCVLAQARWLFWFSLAPALVGLGFGGAAMAGVPIHAGLLISWLG
jgi:hypothetical protein